MATFLSLTSVKCRCLLNDFFMDMTSSRPAMDATLICFRSCSTFANGMMSRLRRDGSTISGNIITLTGMNRGRRATLFQTCKGRVPTAVVTPTRECDKNWRVVGGGGGVGEKRSNLVADDENNIILPANIVLCGQRQWLLCCSALYKTNYGNAHARVYFKEGEGWLFTENIKYLIITPPPTKQIRMPTSHFFFPALVAIFLIGFHPCLTFYKN